MRPDRDQAGGAPDRDQAGGAPDRDQTGDPPDAITVDVEDWFQVQGYAGVVARADWERLPRRIEASMARVLDLFAAAGVTGTFFTLGWIAERHGALIRRIVGSGHELASHGHWHAPVDRDNRAAFAADLRAARHALEDAAGLAVRGYRAPTFSVGPATPWAWDVLAETGHAYSSSVVPGHHDRYGDPAAPRTPHLRAGGAVWELPVTTIEIGGRCFPCAGGGLFRLLPYAVFRAAFRRAGPAAQARIFYTHPWELDPDQPTMAAAARAARLRHRLNLGRTERRLGRLLGDFRFTRLDRAFPQITPPDVSLR